MSMLVKIYLLLLFGVHSNLALTSEEVCFTLNGQHKYTCTDHNRYGRCVARNYQYVYYLGDTPQDVKVPLTECQQNEYAILESVEYSIPKSIQDYSSSTQYSHYCPDKTRNVFDTCYQNRCQCCTKPTAVCTQIFKLTTVPDYRDFCKSQNSQGRCNFYPQRYNFYGSDNRECLDYSLACSVGGGYQWCYARWVTVKYHCESGSTGANTAADKPGRVNIGLIVGTVIGVIVVCLVVILLVILLIRRKKKSEKPSQTRASAAFNNIVFNNDPSVTLTTPPVSGATAVTMAPAEYARVDMSRKNQKNKAATGSEDVDNYENIPDDKCGRDGLVNNPNYEGAPRRNDDNIMETAAIRNNGNQNDMTENTYYESQNVTSNQPIGNDMTENTYYESQDVKKDLPIGDKLTENHYYDSGDVVAPNKGTRDLKGHQPSGSQPETSFKHDGNHHNSHDKDETGTYVYTYGHFKLEGRKRQDKQ